MLKKYFDENVAKDLQKEIERKLKDANIDVSNLKEMNVFINKTIAEILEDDQITIDGKKHYSLSWSALKKWLKKNQRLIITFLLLVACSIIFPFIVYWLKPQNIVSQVAVLIVPLMGSVHETEKIVR